MLKVILSSVKVILKGARIGAKKLLKLFKESPVLTTLSCIAVFFMYNTVIIPLLTQVVVIFTIITYVAVTLIICYIIASFVV